MARYKEIGLEQFAVGVIGTRYVGLATGACLARIGHWVTCVDKDPDLIAELRNGGMPFFEPGLEELVARGKSEGRLSFEDGEALAGVVEDSDAVFIAVGTPQGDDGAPDLSNVAAVARGIGRALAGGRGRENPLVVVNKSTVPVGSGDYIAALVREGAGDAEVDFRVVSNPEFLREGSAVHDTLFPDRIVVGFNHPEVGEFMRRLYGPIIERSFAQRDEPRGVVPFVATDLASAEMIKYAANAFLAVKISFINEISNLCEITGADVKSVATGIGLDERIGSRFLEAGVGWGGSCFPKDVNALRATARKNGYEPTLLDAAVTTNDHQRELVVTKLECNLHTLEGKRVALLGLAFKPGTDDLRESPSLWIASALHARGARVVGYDPVVAAARLSPDLEVAADPYGALSGTHAAVVVTEWEEVVSLDLRRAAALMSAPRLLVDGRNALDPATVRASGLTYEGFGHG